MVEKIIMDGDGGGDEMQLLSVLIAHKDQAQVLGATCTFGNVLHPQVLENTRRILHFLKASHVPVYPGALHQTGGPPLKGDGAHGSNGIGGAELDPSPVAAQNEPAVDFILRQLRENEPGTVTISASGPLSNIAQAIAKDPETMKRVKRIVIMGGCTKDLDGFDYGTGAPMKRSGNITQYAEFNFQQAAGDAKTVMESGLPITLLPMNCTQNLSLTPQRQRAVELAFTTNPKARDNIIKMMTAPADLDQHKFHSSPFMHDVHCALYLLHPEEYETARGNVSVTVTNAEDPKNGHTDFAPREDSNVTVATGVKDANKLFGIYLDSIRACLTPALTRTAVVR